MADELGSEVEYVFVGPYLRALPLIDARIAEQKARAAALIDFNFKPVFVYNYWHAPFFGVSNYLMLYKPAPFLRVLTRPQPPQPPLLALKAEQATLTAMRAGPFFPDPLIASGWLFKAIGVGLFWKASYLKGVWGEIASSALRPPLAALERAYSQRPFKPLPVIGAAGLKLKSIGFDWPGGQVDGGGRPYYYLLDFPAVVASNIDYRIGLIVSKEQGVIPKRVTKKVRR